MLTHRGISYLVPETDADTIARDLEVIRSDLHCTTVMLIARDTDQLLDAARRALDLGLDVYLRPDCTDRTRRQLYDSIREVAAAAEVLRDEHPGRVTLVVGSELSHTVPGIVPGFRSFLRLRVVLRYRRILRRHIDRRLDALLHRVVGIARQHFDGPVTYSAAAWEHVDTSLFDVVGVSLYRSAGNQAGYTERLRALVRDSGKPVVITEFGCGAFIGADDRGAASFMIVNWFADPPVVREGHPRDETVQARYLTELIDLYDAEDVHGCFVFTYTMPGFPPDPDPRHDLDRAGFGIQTDIGDGELRPKQAFDAVAATYGKLANRTTTD